MNKDRINSLIGQIVAEYKKSGEGWFAASIDPELLALMETLQTNINASDNFETIVSHVLDTLIQLQENRAKNNKPPGRFETALLEFVENVPEQDLVTGTYEAFLIKPIVDGLSSAISNKAYKPDFIADITPFEPGVIRAFFKNINFSKDFPTDDIVTKASMVQKIQNILYAKSFSEFENNVNGYIQLVEAVTKKKAAATTKGLVKEFIQRFKAPSAPAEDPSVSVLKSRLEDCRKSSYVALQEESSALDNALNSINIEDGRASLFQPSEGQEKDNEIRRSSTQVSAVRPTMAVLSSKNQEYIDAVNSMPQNIQSAIKSNNVPVAILGNITRYLNGTANLEPDSIEDISSFVLKHGSAELKEKLTARLNVLLPTYSRLELVSIQGQASFFVDKSRADALQEMIEGLSGTNKKILVTLLQQLALINAHSLALKQDLLEQKENKFLSQGQLKDIYTAFQEAQKTLDERKKALIDGALLKIGLKDEYLFKQACEGAKFYNYESEVLDKIGLSPSILRDTIKHYKTHLGKIPFNSELAEPLKDLFTGLLTYVVDNNGKGRSDSVRGLLSVINQFLSTDDIVDTQKLAILRQALTKKMLDIGDTGSRVYQLLKDQLPILIEAEIETDGTRIADNPDFCKIEDFANLYQKITDIQSLVAKGIAPTDNCKAYLSNLPDLILEKLDIKIKNILKTTEYTNPITQADAIQKALDSIRLVKGRFKEEDPFSKKLQEIEKELSDVSKSKKLRDSIQKYVKDIQQEPIAALAQAYKKSLEKYEKTLSSRAFGNTSRLASLQAIRDKLNTKLIDEQALRSVIVSQLGKIEKEYKGWGDPNKSVLYRQLVIMRAELDRMSVLSLTKPLEALQGKHPFIEEQITILSKSVSNFYADNTRDATTKNNFLSKMNSIFGTVYNELSNDKPLSFTPKAIHDLLKALGEINDRASKETIEDFLNKIHSIFNKVPLKEVFTRALESHSPEDFARVEMLGMLQKALAEFDSERIVFSDNFTNANWHKIDAEIDFLVMDAQHALTNTYLHLNDTDTVQKEKCEAQAAMLAQLATLSKVAKPNLAEMLTVATLPNRMACRLLQFFEKAVGSSSEVTPLLNDFRKKMLLDSMDSMKLLGLLSSMQGLIVPNSQNPIFKSEDVKQIALFREMVSFFAGGNDPNSVSYVLKLLVVSLQSSPNQNHDDIRDIDLLREAFSELSRGIRHGEVDAEALKGINAIFTDTKAVERLAFLMTKDTGLKNLVTSIAAIVPANSPWQPLATSIDSKTTVVYEEKSKRNTAFSEFKEACENALKPLAQYNTKSDQNKEENKRKVKLVENFELAIKKLVDDTQQNPEGKVFVFQLIAQLEKLSGQLNRGLSGIGKPSKVFKPLLDKALSNMTSAAKHYRDQDSLVGESATKSHDQLITDLKGLLEVFDNYEPTGVLSKDNKMQVIQNFRGAIEVTTQALDRSDVNVAAELEKLKGSLTEFLRAKGSLGNSSVPDKLGEIIKIIGILAEDYSSPTPLNMTAQRSVSGESGNLGRSLSGSEKTVVSRNDSNEFTITDSNSEGSVGLDNSFNSDATDGVVNMLEDVLGDDGKVSGDVSVNINSPMVATAEPILNDDLNKELSVEAVPQMSNEAIDAKTIKSSWAHLFEELKTSLAELKKDGNKRKNQIFINDLDGKKISAVETITSSVSSIGADVLNKISNGEKPWELYKLELDKLAKELKKADGLMGDKAESGFKQLLLPIIGLINDEISKCSQVIGFKSDIGNIACKSNACGIGSMSQTNTINHNNNDPTSSIRTLDENHSQGAHRVDGHLLQRVMASVGAALCLGTVANKFFGVAAIYLSSAALPFVADVFRLLRNAYA